jgi:hypothetical protein
VVGFRPVSLPHPTKQENIIMALSRTPDFVIGNPAEPYLKRWYIIPRNRYFNIYLHQILRSDDDRALHDHPWWNVSFILKGGYWEHCRMVSPFDGGYDVIRKWRAPGSIVCRRATAAHRLELFIEDRTYSIRRDPDGMMRAHHAKHPRPCWSLFITGPKVREWGFLCPKGWRHWREFIGLPSGEATGAERGPGCGEI